ncbi:MAG: hypothetical protein EXR71_01330 [Myxococcales bacterium]|nr:hypothetical protein [Myxococcales bacterium]
MTLLPLLLILASPPARADSPGITTTVEQAATATPKEMALGAAEMVKDINAAVATVAELLKAAENEKKRNEVLVKCLSGKLPPLETIKEIAGEKDRELKIALASSTHPDRTYRELVVLHGRAKDLLVAAQQCAKSAAGDPGKTVWTVTGGTGGLLDGEEREVEIIDWGTPA